MSRRRRGPRQAEPGRDEPAGFDQALGAKLGRAVTRTVDNATDGRLTKPAISLIVERAEAQSKARRARRAVGSLAAAVAIFAGGQAVWNALPPPSGQRVVVASQSQMADGSGLEAGSDGLDGAGLWVPPTPNGPVLDWVEIPAPPIEGWTAQPTSDGRVVGINWSDDGGQQLMITSDGRNWSNVNAPPAEVAAFSVAGPTWVVVGFPGGRDIEQQDVYLSSDQGESWDRLSIDLGARPRADESVVSGSAYIQAAAVSGDRVVVLATRVDEETGLAEIETAEQLSAGEGAAGFAEGMFETTDIYLSEGDEFELVLTVTGSDAALVATESQFFVNVFGGRADLAETNTIFSSDGRGWEPASTPGDAIFPPSARGSEAWVVSWQVNDGLAIQKVAEDADWEVAAEFAGLSPFGPIEAGVAGLALVAQATPELEGPLDAEPYVEGSPETWLGWSPDGASWGWQPTTEAFGTPSSSFVEIAIGGGFVLALVQGTGAIDPTAGGPAESGFAAPGSRWFLAEVRN